MFERYFNLSDQPIGATTETLEKLARTSFGTFDGSILCQIRALHPHITDPIYIETDGTIRLSKP